MSFTAEFILKLTDRASGGWRKFKDGWESFDAGKVAKGLDSAAAGFDRMGQLGRKGVEGPLRVAASLEQQLSVVQAKSQATTEQLERIKDKSRALGAATKFSATEAASGFEVLSAAGVGVEDQLVAIDPVLTLAAAGFTSIEKAATLNSDVLGAWGQDVTHAAKATDLLIGAANKSKQSIGTLSQSLKDAAPVAAAAGASLGDVLGIQAVLAASGIKGSKAGRATRSLYSRLQAPAAAGKKALRRLRIKTKDKDGNLRDVGTILGEIQTAMDRKFGVGKGGAKRQALMKQIFGEAAAGASIKVMQASTSGLLAKMQKDIETFDAKSAAAAANNNTLGKIAEAKSAWEELQITVGDELLPVVTESVLEFTELARVVGSWAGQNRGAVKTLGMMSLSLAVVGTTMAPVLRGLGMFAKAGKWVAGLGLVKKGMLALRGAVLAASASFRTLAVAMATNPITWVVVGVVALVAAGVLLWKKWDKVSAFFARMWRRMPAPVQSAIRIITAPIRVLGHGAKWLWNHWREAWTGITGSAGKAATFLGEKFTDLTGIPVDISAAWEPVAAFFDNLWGGVVGITERSIDFVAEKLGWVGDQIMDFERSLPEWATGRERVVAGGALAAAKDIRASVQGNSGGGVSALGDAAAGLASRFGGELVIRLESADGAPRIAGTDSKTSGNAGIKLDTGMQGAA